MFEIPGDSPTIKLGNAYDINAFEALSASVIATDKATLKKQDIQGMDTSIFLFMSSTDHSLQQFASSSINASAHYMASNVSAGLSVSSFFRNTMQEQNLTLRFKRRFAAWQYEPNDTNESTIPVKSSLRNGLRPGTGTIVGYVPCCYIDLEFSYQVNSSEISRQMSAAVNAGMSGITFSGDIATQATTAFNQLDKTKILKVNMRYSGPKGPQVEPMQETDDPWTWYTAVMTKLDSWSNELKDASHLYPTKSDTALPQILATTNDQKFSVVSTYFYAPYDELLTLQDKINERDLTAYSKEYLALDRMVATITSVLYDQDNRFGWLVSSAKNDLNKTLKDINSRRDVLAPVLNAIIEKDRYQRPAQYQMPIAVLPEPNFSCAQIANDPNGWVWQVIVGNGNFRKLTYSGNFYHPANSANIIVPEQTINLENLDNNDPSVLISVDRSNNTELTLGIKVNSFNVIANANGWLSKLTWTLYGPSSTYVKQIKDVAAH